MTIAFIHPHQSFLPEIDIYVDFFSSHGIKTKILHPSEQDKADADIEWHFMGVHHKKKKGIITIHEYASASIPPFSRWKDTIKRFTNTTPDYRIFNNEYVQQRFRFADGISSGIRNYGIRPGIDFTGALQKNYDFIYVGTTDKKRELAELFKCFTNGALRNHNLLVLSRDYQELADSLKHPLNIIFKGPVAAAKVYAYILQAKYAINFIPDKLPYNQQTSAKLLDYLACKIPVITTNYPWMREFQRKYGGNYFYLKPGMSNFFWDEIVVFDFLFPDLSGWTWEKQIRKSGILEFLKSRFPELSF